MSLDIYTHHLYFLIGVKSAQCYLTILIFSNLTILLSNYTHTDIVQLLLITLAPEFCVSISVWQLFLHYAIFIS